MQGNTLVKTDIAANSGNDISAQGFINKGVKEVLLLNKRNRTINIRLSTEFKEGKLNTIDADSGDNPAIVSSINSDEIELKPFAVKLIVLNNNIRYENRRL
jgi:hypothetical protein